MPSGVERIADSCKTITPEGGAVKGGGCFPAKQSANLRKRRAPPGSQFRSRVRAHGAGVQQSPIARDSPAPGVHAFWARRGSTPPSGGVRAAGARGMEPPRPVAVFFEPETTSDAPVLTPVRPSPVQPTRTEELMLVEVRIVVGEYLCSNPGSVSPHLLCLSWLKLRLRGGMQFPIMASLVGAEGRVRPVMLLDLRCELGSEATQSHSISQNLMAGTRPHTAGPSAYALQAASFPARDEHADTRNDPPRTRTG